MARLADAVNTSNGQYTMRGDARDAADMNTRLRKASEMPDLEPSPAGLPNRYEQAQSAAEELREAIAGNDKARIQSALKNLQDAYATLRAATSQPAPRTP